MLTLEDWMDIKYLRQEGHSVKAIAKLSGHSRNTVRRVLREKAGQSYQTPARSSCLEPFQEYVKKRFVACGLSAVRLVEEIRPMGYTGSVYPVRRYVATLRPQTKRQAKLTVRFETPAGKQSQADWAHCGRFTDPQGKIIPVYAFVMVLSFSRMMYVEFTTSMQLAELIRCHLNAFEFFGGWTERILYDNMKQVKLDLNTWNPLFIDFCNHYGIVPTTHRAYRARTKGKVERMVFYVRDNFLNGRAFMDVADLNTQGRHWLDHTSNVRVHATTGQRPVDLLSKECLTPVTSVAPYQFYPALERTVDYEGFVRYGRSRYSVPPEYAGTKVWVGQRDAQICIRTGAVIVAEHEAAHKPGLTVTQPEHIAALWQLSLQRTKEPLPSWTLTFDQSVTSTPLTAYEEVIR